MCTAQAMTRAQHFETRRDRMATNVVGCLTASHTDDHDVPPCRGGILTPAPVGPAPAGT